MSIVNTIANNSLTGIYAYTTLLNNTANNVANMNTDGYKPLETIMQESSSGGVNAVTTMSANADNVDLSTEAVDMITAATGFKASISVLKTDQEMQKSIIDLVV